MTVRVTTKKTMSQLEKQKNASYKSVSAPAGDKRTTPIMSAQIPLGGHTELKKEAVINVSSEKVSMQELF